MSKAAVKTTGAAAALEAARARLGRGEKLLFAHAPDGFDAFLCADLARALARGAEGRPAVFVHVARDSARSAAFREALRFANPDVEILDVPGWDCQPYDRVSPHAEIVARRMTALSRLARASSSAERPRIVTTTADCLLQRVPPKKMIAAESFSAAPGNVVKLDELARWLEANGFLRASTVRETGEYAQRGGLLDLYPPGLPAPIRLDFFGDTLESIRSFDPETQRAIGQLRALDLTPMSELRLTSDTMRRFRQSYATRFGGQTRGDALYEAVSEGRRHHGMEHWLPLFYERMDTLFDYLDDAPLMLDSLVEEAAGERLEQIADYYDARKEANDLDPANSSYKPLEPKELYLTRSEWREALDARANAQFSPFASERGDAIDCGVQPGRDFAPERNEPEVNVFQAAADHVQALRRAGKTVIVAGWSDGSCERLGHVLQEHGLKDQSLVGSLGAALAQGKGASGVALAVLGVEHGFETDAYALIGEQDILGDRLVRRRRKRKPTENLLGEVAALTAGDLVAHVDHGIGRFIGLETITAAGAPHDCLELHYAGGDKLYLPVENIELLTRYGGEDTEAQLDKLGGAGWQTRKARMKNRIREMAKGLIAIAAQRQLRQAPKLVPPEGLYDEFCARFPYDETEDQLAAIEAVLDDLAAGRPMDRLVCGDVGFGKTEVALRAAFTSAINGKQVAVVAPTTLLARQHYRNFCERFAGLPIKIGRLSRMVGTAEARETKKELAEGKVEILIGTHAVLGKGVSFSDLGLVIIDEEQHFGVGHKERLKELRAEVHVLTLSATPIPRTLQLAMTGVRELSLITTPPVDRLAVRSFISPFDPLIVREALLRERYRGGQAFFVCPRIEDLEEAAAFLRENLPESKYVVAHGQMSASELEDKMSAFYDGKFDILLSTTIIESGLDIPTANTLIVWRADMFGLAQLYQLRGRVGRSKTRAYALFTTPANRSITPQAQKRLEVLQTLDTLGAGFQLASHDLDIRGAGNLLGEEQSGHIKEVGYELYQQMLSDAITMLKAGVEEPEEEVWSPTIAIGAPVTIPEEYVPDLTLRLQLYRRLSTLETDQDIEAFAAEMIDRFGPIPPEVEQLFEIVAIKAMCRRAHVEKVDTGPKGVIVSFRDNHFADPAGLVRYVSEQGTQAKVRPDMRIVFIRDFETMKQRLAGTRRILRALVEIAEKGKAA
ncbi:transcription-repair coupling factor [Methylocystis echinoides]|uniref:Transcription-repair-coupling factor n=1 Tax=Methylocystis echinoides TaxID=29468 RepID=A0A9W6GS74_9HYPH|nr:transcription-repair-coupling factor [Methylocystis echinoides]